MCVYSWMATGDGRTVPYTCLACDSPDSWSGRVSLRHRMHNSFGIRCDTCEQLFTSASGASEHFQEHLDETRVQSLVDDSLCVSVAPAHRKPELVVSTTVTAERPTPSATLLSPVALLYVAAGHLTWTANQLAASTPAKGPTGGTLSTTADARFRQYLSDCFPEELLEAETMAPAQVARKMVPYYDDWLRQARLAFMGYPPMLQ